MKNFEISLALKVTNVLIEIENYVIAFVGFKNETYKKNRMT